MAEELRGIAKRRKIASAPSAAEAPLSEAFARVQLRITQECARDISCPTLSLDACASTGVAGMLQVVQPSETYEKAFKRLSDFNLKSWGSSPEQGFFLGSTAAQMPFYGQQKKMKKIIWAAGI